MFKNNAEMLYKLATILSTKRINSIVKNIEEKFSDFFGKDNSQLAFSLLLLDKAIDLVGFKYSKATTEILERGNKKYLLIELKQ